MTCKAGAAATENLGVFPLNTYSLSHTSDTVTGLAEQDPWQTIPLEPPPLLLVQVGGEASTTLSGDALISHSQGSRWGTCLCARAGLHMSTTCTAWARHVDPFDILEGCWGRGLGHM